MEKSVRIFAAALAVLCVSCAKEISENNPSPAKESAPVTFVAGNTAAKTSLGEDKSVLWSEDDAISVFDSALSNNKFEQSDLASDGSTASFSGEAVESDTYYAIYPYRSTNSSASEGSFSSYLSPDQFAVPGSFGQGANLSFGVSQTEGDNKYFTMQQVGAFLKFSFSGCSNVTSICLKAIGGEKISGAVNVSYSAGAFTAASANNGAALDEVTLYPASGSYIAPGTYYAVVLPGTLASGLQLIFTENTGGVEKVISARVEESFTLVRNKISAIPGTIALPAESNPMWMAQQTLNVLFKAPQHLLDGEGTVSLPFEAPASYKSATVTVDGVEIGVNFASKTPSTGTVSRGFYVSNGTCNGWYFTLPAISGKKLVKVEYYTSESDKTGNPCITNTAKDYATIYGAVNDAAAGYSKYVWNLDRAGASWLAWYGNASHSSAVALNGFRAVYRDSEGIAKAVVSATTASKGAKLVSGLKLEGSFDPYDDTATGYSFGFDYKPVASPGAASLLPRRASSGEDFGEGGSFSLQSGQDPDWTSVDAAIVSAYDFEASLPSAPAGTSLKVRAWARVGDDGDKVYGEENTVEVLAKVSGGTEWKYGDGEFFTVWKACSNNSSDSENYNWENRLKDGSLASYTYGADGILYETTSTGIDFRAKSYLKFGAGQQFSFVSAQAGTAILSMSCESTGSSTRTISVFVNGARVTTFASSANGAQDVVTSDGFPVNEGDVVSFTINNNANLRSIAYSCAAQGGSFDVDVASNSLANRDVTYNFTVTASSDLAWNAAVTTGAGEGVVLSKSSGTGSDSFTLTVPVNYSWTDVAYAVTVTTSDERIAAGNRSQEINLTQAKPTKVLFGCQWANSFLTAWSAAGYVANEEFSAQLVTVTSSNSGSSLASGYIRGNGTFQFTAGETGKGRLHFYPVVKASNKKFVVYKNDESQAEFNSTSSDYGPAEGVQVDITVEAGDVIKIVSSGSNQHYLYCSGSKPITWSLAPTE